MLETIREYAREQLALAVDADDAAAAHAAWALQLAERTAAPKFGTLAQAAALDRLGPDLDNVRAALRWHDARGDDQARWRLASAASGYWVLRGDRDEGRRWLRGAPAELALGPGAHGESTLHVTAPRGVEPMVEAARFEMAAARAAGDLRREAVALRLVGKARAWVPIHDEVTFWPRVVEVGRSLDEPRLVAKGLHCSVSHTLRSSGLEAAAAALAEVLALYASGGKLLGRGIGELPSRQPLPGGRPWRRCRAAVRGRALSLPPDRRPD